MPRLSSVSPTEGSLTAVTPTSAAETGAAQPRRNLDPTRDRDVISPPVRGGSVCSGISGAQSPVPNTKRLTPEAKWLGSLGAPLSRTKCPCTWPQRFVPWSVSYLLSKSSLDCKTSLMYLVAAPISASEIEFSALMGHGILSFSISVRYIHRVSSKTGHS